MQDIQSDIRRVANLLLFVLLALLSGSVLLNAQVANTGTVLGVVTDPSGAVVPGAEIRLVDSATGEVRSATTNEAGQYVFVAVKPGTYSVTVSAPGFQQSILSSALVQVSKSVTISFTLKIGQSTEQVVVTATPGAELQTLDATVGNVIGGDTLALLPTQQRNVTSLLLLQPAAIPQQGPNQGAGSGGQIAGARSDQNTYVLDGSNITEAVSATQREWTTSGGGGPEGVIPTPIESIEEFRVATNNQAASFSGSSGGQVTIVTKRGGNVFHGSAYEYLQNDNLNANTWTNNRLATPRPESKDNRFGVSLGGYIPKLPEILKSYFYFHYEGRRLSRNVQVRRTVPTDTLKQGILRFGDASGNIISYNLATSKQCGPGTNSVCDPRGIGLNPLVGQIWNQYMPPGNDPTGGDQLNTIAFSAPMAMPINNNFAVFRLDHSFGQNWQFMASYRYFKEFQAQSSQYDIGGLLPGGVKGIPHSTASTPRQPRYAVLGLTGQLSSTATNDFRFSYMRERFDWATAGATPQVPGTAAALAIGGEGGDLAPVNLAATSIRTRAWKSHNWSWNDNFSKVTGNHLIQFGGSLSHLWVNFWRGDGQLSVLKPRYIITQATGLNIPAAYRPPTCSATITTKCVPSSQINNWNNLYASVLGLVESGNVLRTRDAHLNLNPLETPILTETTFKTYSLYLTDAWRLRPSLTINYGLNWSVGMPPLERSGKLSIAVDSSNKPIDPNLYMDLRREAALQGRVYNPTVGFSPVQETGRKYPIDPVWGSFAPRIAVAWNPNFSSGWRAKIFGGKRTVIRGGYARLYDRMNQVVTVVDVQQGFGFIVNLLCQGPTPTGQCLGTGDPTTAFRPGTDGRALSFPAITQQLTPPLIPGVPGFPGANEAFTTSSYHIDPTYRPAANNQYDLTIQRELPKNSLLEIGYIGRTASHLFSSYQLNQVPFFMVSGGQSFAQAFDNVGAQILTGGAITPQPFFEAALAGSSLCKAPYANCTAGVVARYGGSISTQRVRDTWNGIQPSFVFGPATAATNQLNSLFFYNSQGESSYNAGFISFRQRFADRFTLNASFTYSHSLDENGQWQVSDSAFSNSFDPHYDYGTSNFNRKFVFNLLGVYHLPFGAGRTTLSKILRGWSIAPILAWHTGQPLKVANGGGQEFGQLTAASSGAILTVPNTFGSSAHGGVTGNTATQVATAGNPATGGTGLNLFADPDAVFKAFRPIRISQDTTSGGGGQLRGMSRWNLDVSIARKFKVAERVGASFEAQFFNAFNHVEFNDPSVSLQSPQSFGVITGQYNTPRAIQLGIRIEF